MTTAVPPGYVYRGEVYTYVGSCKACSRHLSVRWTREQASDQSHYLSCPGCQRRRGMLPVDGKQGKRNCGEWCTSGTGRSCTCTCGGANHGLMWRVR